MEDVSLSTLPLTSALVTCSYADSRDRSQIELKPMRKSQSNSQQSRRVGVKKSPIPRASRFSDEDVRKGNQSEIKMRSVVQSNNIQQSARAMFRKSAMEEAVGIFSTANIRKNEVILVNSPSLRSGLANTNPSEILINTTHSLQICEAEKSCDLCFDDEANYRNALPFQNTSVCYEEIFSRAGRAYCSGTPDARLSWSEERGQLAFEALRDIEQGEELILTYVCRLAGNKWRSLGFICHCLACSPTTAQVHVKKTYGLGEGSSKPRRYICNNCKSKGRDTEEDMTRDMMVRSLVGNDAAGIRTGVTTSIVATGKEDLDTLDVIWFAQQCLG
ncbi:uncharacterized protein BP5553_03555 [Venustampulla echinocandica]|uniref:SET domain-containing protein n=1 Tax=Venustampulla echinocandica TaxID=2656787 RepID=A0A370TUK2_9HELO|nr:uncharacterized protein BP5553_03555 [Venustampulla echinocandica]RDL39215.1 hypothetical protein BP5553_03555 [Venustampulla echinocandica]